MGIGIYQCENRKMKCVPQLLHQEPCVQIWNALSLKADRVGHCGCGEPGYILPAFYQHWLVRPPTLTSRRGSLVLTVRKMYNVQQEEPYIFTPLLPVYLFEDPTPWKHFSSSRNNKVPTQRRSPQCYLKGHRESP